MERPPSQLVKMETYTCLLPAPGFSYLSIKYAYQVVDIRGERECLRVGMYDKEGIL